MSMICNRPEVTSFSQNSFVTFSSCEDSKKVEESEYIDLEDYLEARQDPIPNRNGRIYSRNMIESILKNVVLDDIV